MSHSIWNSSGSLYLWWSRMAAMTGKELLQLARDTLLVLAVLYLFTLDIMMAGGVKMDLSKAKYNRSNL